MRKLAIAAAIVFLGLAAAAGGRLHGQSAKTFGGSADDSPGSILIAPDGGMVISGTTQHQGAAGGTDAWMWILMVSRDGRIAWKHVWECYSVSDVFKRSSAVVAVPGGGYLLAATMLPRQGSGSDSYVFLARLGSDGAVIWEKKYGFGGIGAVVQQFGIRDACPIVDPFADAKPRLSRRGREARLRVNPEQAPALMPGSRGVDGGIIAVGSVHSGNGDDKDLWAARFDWEGRLIWQRRYSGPGRDEGFSVKEESDGTFYLGGRTFSYGAGGYDFWVLNMTGQGDVIWQKTYGGPGNDSLRSLDIAPGGGCVLAGESDSFPLWNTNAWVLKLDRTGAVEWQRSFGGEGGDGASAVRASADGGAVLVGGLFSSKAKDLFLLKLSAGGGTEWFKTFGESVGPYELSNESGQAVALLPGGGYAVAGTSDLLGIAGQDFLLIEVSPAWDPYVCRFLKSARIDSAETLGLTETSTALVSATQAVPGEFASVEDASFVLSTRPICPSKKKKPRR